MSECTKDRTRIFILKKGFRVIGFEANPENAAFCRERFAEAIEDRKTW